MSRRKTADNDLATTEITGGQPSPDSAKSESDEATTKNTEGEPSPNAPTAEPAAEPGSTSAAEPGEDQTAAGRETSPTTPPSVPAGGKPKLTPPFGASTAKQRSLPPSPFGPPELHIALQVSSVRPKGFYRAGLHFGAQPRTLMPWDIDELGASKVELIEAEGSLKTRRLTWADLTDAQRRDIMARLV